MDWDLSSSWKPSSWPWREFIHLRVKVIRGVALHFTVPLHPLCIDLAGVARRLRSRPLPSRRPARAHVLERACKHPPAASVPLSSWPLTSLRRRVWTKIANSVFSPLCPVCLCVFHCLSRIPVQRPGAGRGGGPRPGGAAAPPRAGGRQLLLPAPLRPADVHHAHALQQENSHQRQGQRNRGGQGRLPVSCSVYMFFLFRRSNSFNQRFSMRTVVSVFASHRVIHACRGSICCGCILMLVSWIGSFWQLLFFFFFFLCEVGNNGL